MIYFDLRFMSVYTLKLLQILLARFSQFDWSVAGEGRKKWPIFRKNNLKVRDLYISENFLNFRGGFAHFDWSLY